MICSTFVCDPATLPVTFGRVADNTGANTPGTPAVDGMTVAAMEDTAGVPGYLIDLRTQLRSGSFRPLPVRERIIPNLLVTERHDGWEFPPSPTGSFRHRSSWCWNPIFEADFTPVPTGFGRCGVHDAVAEIQRFGT